MNVTEMSLEELLALQDEIKKGLIKQKDKAIIEIVSKMKAMDISISDLTIESNGLSRKGKKREPKYRNPDNPSQTWCGVGKNPKWFDKNIAEGKSKEIMLISSE